MNSFPRAAYAPLKPYAPDRRPVPVDLSDNTNLWGPHPAALERIRGADAAALTRYPSVYADEFRDAVSRRFGIPVGCVATGCGSDDLLDSAFRAAGEPGDRITFGEPTFSMVAIFARMNGMEPVGLPWLPGHPPDPEALLAPDPALVYLCRPNNPTGEVVPVEWVERLLGAVGPTGPIVLLDEAYADFAGDSFLRRAPDHPRLLVLRTLSKSFGLAGLRVAFAVGSQEVIEEVEKSRGPYKVNRLAESAAAAALADDSGWVEGILRDTRDNRGWLEGELVRRGVRLLPSGGNFLLGQVRDAAAVTAALRALGVAIRPFPGLAGFGDGIRVSIGPRPLLERFLEAWDALPADLRIPAEPATGPMSTDTP